MAEPTGAPACSRVHFQLWLPVLYRDANSAEQSVGLAQVLGFGCRPISG